MEKVCKDCSTYFVRFTHGKPLVLPALSCYGQFPNTLLFFFFHRPTLFTAFSRQGGMGWVNTVARSWACDWQHGDEPRQLGWLRWRHALSRPPKMKRNQQCEQIMTWWKIRRLKRITAKLEGGNQQNAYRQFPIVDGNLWGELISPQG